MVLSILPSNPFCSAGWACGGRVAVSSDAPQFWQNSLVASLSAPHLLQLAMALSFCFFFDIGDA